MISFAFSLIYIIFAIVYSEKRMSSRLGVVWNIMARYKYIITCVLGIAIVGFIDDNSFMHRIKYELQISELEDEIKVYNQRNEVTMRQLLDIQKNPRAIEKIARERYFMKADDEDIYVLSTDQQPTPDGQAESDEEQ